MAAIVTDEFRLFNADNFVKSVSSAENSYYIFVGLPNPVGPGYGRSTSWNSNPPSPTDNFAYIRHTYDTMMYGRKITPGNIKRLIRKVTWTPGTRYEQYRDDYSTQNVSPNTGSTRLYDANYYVVNRDFRVYICLSNGSSGFNPEGSASEDEPTFVDTEPSAAGSSGDGYIWKYLFTVTPADVIKFDSTDFITVPNDWLTSTDPQIASIRESGNSPVNDSQLKQVYIDESGNGYSGGPGQAVNIIGDGEGASAIVDVNNGAIERVIVSRGGKNYTWGLVDLGPLNSSAGPFAKLDVIIPPSLGHGYDIYEELGTDKVLAYARFDDSDADFPVDTQFAQVGIIKNPTTFNSTTLFTANSFTAAASIKINSTFSGELEPGDLIEQINSLGETVKAYVVSFDTESTVLKYIQDRSLYYNPNSYDNQDYLDITTGGKKLPFDRGGGNIASPGGNFVGAIDTTFNGSTVVVGNKVIQLGVEFTDGLATSEINKPSGEILYLDNRPVVPRNPRQKEDVKIILEF